MAITVSCSEGRQKSITFKRAANSRPVFFTVRVSLCYELISSAERNKQTARG
jgi:hypothetical protein